MVEGNNGLRVRACNGCASRRRGLVSAFAGLVAFLCGGAFAEQCLTFTPGTESNQVTDFLQTDVTLPGDSAFTWEAWVNPAVDTLAENRIMGQTDWTSEGRLILELRKHSSTGGQNKFVCFYRVNGANFRTSSPTAVVPAGAWTHVAVTRNGSTLKIYVNGVLDSTETNYVGPLPTEINSYPVRFGIGYAFNGSLADVRVWSGERSAKEIRANYRRRLLGTESGLVGYWRMDEQAGLPSNVITGMSATRNGYDGTAEKGAMVWAEDNRLFSSDVYIVCGEITRTGASCDMANVIGDFDSRDVMVALANGFNLNSCEPHCFIIILR